MPQNARMLFKHVMGPLDTLTSHFFIRIYSLGIRTILLWKKIFRKFMRTCFFFWESLPKNILRRRTKKIAFWRCTRTAETIEWFTLLNILWSTTLCKFVKKLVWNFLAESGSQYGSIYPITKVPIKFLKRELWRNFRALKKPLLKVQIALVLFKLGDKM